MPMTIPASPLAARSSGSVRWVLVIDPVSRSTRVPSPDPKMVPPSASSPSMVTIER